MGPDPPRLDINVAHQSRIYNYLLGGKDNFAVDRRPRTGPRGLPRALARAAKNNRAFLARAVRYLVSAAGIRQFLDSAPACPRREHPRGRPAHRPHRRICYVDNDPAVLTHARALLSSDPAGMTGYVTPTSGTASESWAKRRRSRLHPADAVMLLAILHVIPDEDDPWRVVAHTWPPCHREASW